MIVAVSSVYALKEIRTDVDIVVSALLNAPVISGAEQLHLPIDDVYLGQIRGYKDAIRKVLAIDDEKRIVIHCEHGMSRSPALAIALLYKHNPDDVDAFLAQNETVEPNPLILLYADEILGANGDLMRRCRDRYKGRRL